MNKHTTLVFLNDFERIVSCGFTDKNFLEKCKTHANRNNGAETVKAIMEDMAGRKKEFIKFYLKFTTSDRLRGNHV